MPVNHLLLFQSHLIIEFNMNSKPDILVIGAGYVGLASAVFLATKGYHVTVAEKNDSTVSQLQKGKLHFREQLLAKNLKQVVNSKKLQVSLPDKKIYQDSKIIFIAIDSANQSSWKMRMGSFTKIAQWIGGKKHKNAPVIILKSTNIIGFSEQFRKLLDKTPFGEHIKLVVNPEFLREGFAFEDTVKPWRIIIGSDNKNDAKPLLDIYKNIYSSKIPIVKTDCKSAELIKLASNVYLAHRLAFIHEIADFARLEKLDVESIKKGIGLDQRIGLDYFTPGLGFGGSCLPKDCILINSDESKNSYKFESAIGAMSVNEKLIKNLIKNLIKSLGDLRGQKITILGAAFKSEIDDTRGSRAVVLAQALKKRGAKIVFNDPYLSKSEKLIAGTFTLESDLNKAVKASSAIIIGTPHKKFKSLKPTMLAKKVKLQFVVDYFGLLNNAKWEKQGFKFI